MRHGIDDFFIGMCASHRKHGWVHGFDFFGIFAKAAGDNHLAVFGNRLTNGVKRFLHRRFDKAASIDHHQICAIIVTGDLVAITAKLGDNALAIHQGFGAAKRHKTNLRRFCRCYILSQLVRRLASALTYSTVFVMIGLVVVGRFIGSLGIKNLRLAWHDFHF